MTTPKGAKWLASGAQLRGVLALIIIIIYIYIYPNKDLPILFRRKYLELNSCVANSFFILS